MSRIYTCGGDFCPHQPKCVSMTVPSEVEIKRTLDNKAEIQQNLVAQMQTTRKLFYQLLDDYFKTILASVQALKPNVAQTNIDAARLALIREYELFAGVNSSVDANLRQQTEINIDYMRRKLSELTCPGEVSQTQNPVHEHKDGSWWFWDETWTDEMGPYDTQELAKASLSLYCRDVLSITDTKGAEE